MVENILTVACAVSELADKLNNFGMNIVNARVNEVALTGLLDCCFYLTL